MCNSPTDHPLKSLITPPPPSPQPYWVFRWELLGYFSKDISVPTWLVWQSAAISMRHVPHYNSIVHDSLYNSVDNLVYGMTGSNCLPLQLFRTWFFLIYLHGQPRLRNDGLPLAAITTLPYVILFDIPPWTASFTEWRAPIGCYYNSSVRDSFWYTSMDNLVYGMTGSHWLPLQLFRTWFFLIYLHGQPRLRNDGLPLPAITTLTYVILYNIPPWTTSFTEWRTPIACHYNSSVRDSF